MAGRYDREDDIDVRIRRGSPSAGPVRYVQAPPRPRSHYDPPGHSYLVPVRSRSKERSRSRERRASSPPAPAPVIINNRIYNEQPSDDESERRIEEYRYSRRRHRSRSSSRSRSRSSSYMTREEWEAEQTRKELEALRIANSREKDDHRLIKEYKEEAELQRAKRELDDIKDREARAEEEERIKKAMELQRLRDEDKAKEEEDRREKMAKDAVERYKQEERDRIAKEKKIKEEKEKEAKAAVEKYMQEERDRIAKERQEKEERDREYKRRLEEDLRRSGLDDDEVKAILKKEKVKKEKEKEPAQPPVQNPHYSQPPAQLQHYPQPQNVQQIAHHAGQYSHGAMVHHSHTTHEVAHVEPAARPTYTRMSRKHLSIETLRDFNVDFQFDENPDYVLIKRWVPEWEQDQLWRHTKYIREKRGKRLMIEEKRHHSAEPEFEWVRKKSHDRRRSRSKSPSLLMYLAGARPS